MATTSPAPGVPASPIVGVAKPKKRWLRRLFKVGLCLFLLIGIVIVIAPTVATKTFLKGTVKSQLASNVGGGDVSTVSFGWTNGLVMDGLTIPSAAAWAKDKTRPAVKLDHFAARLSVPAMIKAAITHGEVDAAVDADKAQIYLELHPDGKTNLATPEKKTPTEPAKVVENKPVDSSKPQEQRSLPFTAKAVVSVKEWDIEIADCTSSTGAIQRTAIKGLRIGASAHVARDMTADVATISDAKGEEPTLAFDSLKVTLEQPNQPAKNVISIDKLAIVCKATFKGPKVETADKAPLAALAPVHQLDTKPVITCARVWSDDFDMSEPRIEAAVETPAAGQKVAKLLIEGTLKGAHQGKVHLDVVADLCQKPRLPVTVTIDLRDVDISGTIAKVAPTILPVLGGATTDAGAQHLPALTIATKAEAAAFFDKDGKLEQDPTLDSIKDDGNLKLGPGSLDGSKIIQGFLDAYEKIDLKDVLTKALGDSPFKFEGVEEVFNVKDGSVNIQKLELTKQTGSSTQGVIIAGTCKLSNKHYKISIGLDPELLKKQEPDVAKLIACVEKAGGIQIEGEVGGDYTVTTPPAKALAKAMLDGGALELFRSKNPKAAAKLDAALSKGEKALDDKIGGDKVDEAKKKLKGLLDGDKKDDEKKDDSPKLPFGIGK